MNQPSITDLTSSDSIKLSPLHERVIEAMDVLASSGIASKIPGGTELSKMVLKRVRRDLGNRSEEELRTIIDHAFNVLEYVRSGKKSD